MRIDPATVAAPTGSEAPPQLEAGQTITVRYCNDQTAPHHHAGAFRQSARSAVLVHGGSWISGDHDTGSFIIDQIGPALTEDGFVVANVNYRLGPDHYWPAQIEDVKCAVRYLRAPCCRPPGSILTGSGHGATAPVGTWSRCSAPAPRKRGGTRALLRVESSTVEAVVDLSRPVEPHHHEHRRGQRVREGHLRQPPRTRSTGELPQALLEASPVHYVWVATRRSSSFTATRTPSSTPSSPRSLRHAPRRWRPSHAGHRHGGRPSARRPVQSAGPDAITRTVVDFLSSHLDRAGGGWPVT